MSDNANSAGTATDNSLESLKLVIACWKHLSSDNKINYQAVADELSITSKAAAAKRFERLLKTYNMKISELLNKGSPASGAQTNTSQPRAAAATTAEGTNSTPTKRKRATKAAAATAECKPKRSKATPVAAQEQEQEPELEAATDDDQQRVVLEPLRPSNSEI